MTKLIVHNYNNYCKSTKKKKILKNNKIRWAQNKNKIIIITQSNNNCFLEFTFGRLLFGHVYVIKNLKISEGSLNLIM